MTVKGKRRGRPAGQDSELSADSIMLAAKALMKSEGKVPSIRKLAGSLGVDPMAIYYYYQNKNALLEAMTTSLIEDVYQPSEGAEWRAELCRLSESYLHLLSQYPGLLEILLSMESDNPSVVFIERFERVVAGLNLTAEEKNNAIALLIDYLHGFALAMNCNRDREALHTGMIAGALELYCRALEKSA
ncbi:TetR/AcrR family transcriptional regulator [Vibrio sp. WXL210]|uniref:TetR/AcrR family transcriptional regulator n=1 Tax=Vibrio sp. WXL210 TaxID=3450709 RepID=UPI003EC51559